ncbi:hypothetical protein D3C81_1605030 [compost metagenome]
MEAVIASGDFSGPFHGQRTGFIQASAALHRCIADIDRLPIFRHLRTVYMYRQRGGPGCIPLRIISPRRDKISAVLHIVQSEAVRGLLYFPQQHIIAVKLHLGNSVPVSSLCINPDGSAFRKQSVIHR